MKYFLKEILKGKNIGRAMLFDFLKKIFESEDWLNGKYTVLELGSAPASYHRALPSSWNLKRSNINSEGNLDYFVDAEKHFLFDDNYFDGVVFFNLIYLVDDYSNCLTESLRVSKRFIMFNAPLVSGIAPHPHDFNRFSKDRLIGILENLKIVFKPIDYQIIPIGGSFSSAVALFDIYLRFRLVKIPIYILAVALDRLDKFIKRDCPSQYLVLIKKQ